MDEKTLQKAVDDISTIKEVIERTGRSLTSFSKIFIYWGFLFILVSGLNLYMSINSRQVIELAQRYPIIYFSPLTALIAVIIYFGVSKKLPLIGLEKHLIKIWLLIVFLNLLPERIMLINSNSTVSLNEITFITDRLNMLYFSLAIALIATGLFTGFKQPMYIGILFIAISIIISFNVIPIGINSLTMAMNFVALPFTFFYTGLYLRSKKLGGTPIGNQFNS